MNYKKNNNKIHISLTFSGKFSPAKSSDYTLDLGKIDLSNPANTNQMFEEIEENKLFAERQERLGTTRESSLFNTLGRHPG